MNIEFDKTRFSQTFGKYLVGPATALFNPQHHARAQEYKRRLSGQMRPIGSDDIYRIPKNSGYYVSRKYDGEFALLFFDGTDVISVNPGGTVRIGLPAFRELATLLKKANLESAILAAELYLKSETRTRVHHVIRTLRSPGSETELQAVNLAVFDVIEFNGNTPVTTRDVFSLLDKWLAGGKSSHPAEYQILDSVEAISALFQEWVVSGGAEGLVVRHDQTGWFKIKLRHTLDAAIIGFSEGAEDRKGMIHDLLVALVRNDGTFHELCRVGGGYDEDNRRRFAEELRQRVVPSDYVAVNSDFVAYQMIEPGPVVEISCLDLITENSKGGAINRMVLDWDGTRFTPLSRLPLASVISPQFVRTRDDKEANAEDVNIRQIGGLVEIPDTEKSARAETLQPSEILERVVYTKVLKGRQMVRKLLLWKTNKAMTNEFPEYVVYLTDFSPNRQTPLERDIRIAPDEPTARRLFAELADKNFVGGWQKFS